MGDLQLKDDIKEIDERVDSVFEKFYEWGEIQDSKRDAYEEKQSNKRVAFEDRIINKIDKLGETIVRKTEMDTAMISQLQELRIRVEKMETTESSNVKLLTTVGVKVDQMLVKLSKYDLGKMGTDINAAHSRLAVVEPLVKDIETRGGKMASKILYAIGIAAIGAAIGYFVSLL